MKEEHRVQSIGCRRAAEHAAPQSTEHRAVSMECRVQSTEHGVQSVECCRVQSAAHTAQSRDHGVGDAEQRTWSTERWKMSAEHGAWWNNNGVGKERAE